MSVAFDSGELSANTNRGDGGAVDGSGGRRCHEIARNHAAGIARRSRDRVAAVPSTGDLEFRLLGRRRIDPEAAMLEAVRRQRHAPSRSRDDSGPARRDSCRPQSAERIESTPPHRRRLAVAMWCPPAERTPLDAGWVRAGQPEDLSRPDFQQRHPVLGQQCRKPIRKPHRLARLTHPIIADRLPRPRVIQLPVTFEMNGIVGGANFNVRR